MTRCIICNASTFSEGCDPFEGDGRQIITKHRLKGDTEAYCSTCLREIRKNIKIYHLEDFDKKQLKKKDIGQRNRPKQKSSTKSSALPEQDVLIE